MSFSAWAKVLCLILALLCFASAEATCCIESRKLLMRALGRPAAMADSLILNVLPKGGIPPSAPSKRGHTNINSEQLFARHLGSVPSPGVGN
uniref:Uncharacterized protein n=1 Tax=Kalanchoe fedtschenkoi TaxID=63787 RepID=A0A7N0RDQ5_KALFE